MKFELFDPILHQAKLLLLLCYILEFLTNNKGKHFTNDEHFKDLHLFYEFFDGDNGKGLGASHQTGWTALIANLIMEMEGD